VKLAEVLQKERRRKRLSIEETAARLGVTAEEYGALEAGDSPAERWGPLLAQLAISLEIPTALLLTERGKANEAKAGQAGPLIREARERRDKTVVEMATELSITPQEYEEIEAGGSGIEQYGPLLLRFAAAIEQPVFNLFYPGGLPLATLAVLDYP
jgi:transcriptional regulator with XRE-family HTH domain